MSTTAAAPQSLKHLTPLEHRSAMLEHIEGTIPVLEGALHYIPPWPFPAAGRMTDRGRRFARIIHDTAADALQAAEAAAGQLAGEHPLQERAFEATEALGPVVLMARGLVGEDPGLPDIPAGVSPYRALEAILEGFRAARVAIGEAPEE